MKTPNDLAKLYMSNYNKIRTSVKEKEVIRAEDLLMPESVQLEPEVILCRMAEPRFFAGAKNNGTPVWAYDAKRALPVQHDRLHLYAEKLSEELFAMWPQ